MGTTSVSIGSRGIVGKLMMTGFGLFFAFIGSQFVKQEWKNLQEIQIMQQWVQTNCTIENCTVEDHGEDFRLAVSYSYTVNGQRYTNDRYGKNQYLTTESITEIKNAETRLPPGKTIFAYYNPDNPAEAILDLPTVKSATSSLGMTCIFPVIGLLLASAPWLRRKKSPKEKKEISPKAFLIPFGSIFALVGLLMLKPFLVEPIQKTQSAKNWDEVPATVVASKVKSHDSDDGTTYSPYIAYRYEVYGQEYFGDQYSFMGGSSSGYESKAAVVRQYPEGHPFNLYVNPSDPAESVIRRETGAELLLGLIPLVFSIIGIVIIISAFRSGKASGSKLDDAQARNGVVALKGSSPIASALFITIFAIIWNGVVYLIWRSQAGLLFLSLFGFFGIVSIAAAIKNILAIFNPRPTVEITPGNIRPGTHVALRWRMNGRPDRIGTLKIELKCLKVKMVTSGHGKNRSSRVVKTPLYECEIFNSTNPLEIPQGALGFIIPGDYPSSRPGNTNGIEWQLVFHGDIPRWPDLKDEMKFLVYPEQP